MKYCIQLKTGLIFISDKPLIHRRYSNIEGESGIIYTVPFHVVTTVTNFNCKYSDIIARWTTNSEPLKS